MDLPKNPVVSVVVPLFNKGPHIARAIQSIFDQTEQNFEIIIIDGHSTDEGPEIVKSYGDPRIFFFEQTTDGVSSARNEGVNHSRSEFVAFLDADDEWQADHLETLLRLCNMYPEAGAYTTAYLVKSANTRIRNERFFGIPEDPWEGVLPSYFQSAAYGSPPVWTSVVGVPKRILEEMNGFSTKAWWGEDTDLWGRIALKYPIAFSWKGKGIYHLEAVNRACNRIEPIEENIFVRTALKALERDDVKAEVRADLLDYIAKKRIDTAWFNLKCRRPDMARRNLKNCRSPNLRRAKIWALLWTYMPFRVYTGSRIIRDKITSRLP